MGALPQPLSLGPPICSPLPAPLSLSAEMRRQDGPPSSSAPVWTNKGIAWSEAEHLAFLKGLQSFGKGQWKQISRYYVPSRTPTQVASHAQKHFLRVTGATKRRSRFSTLEDSAIASGLVASQPHQTPGAGGAEASAVGPVQLPGSAQSSGSGWAGPPRQGLNPTTSFPFSAKFVMPPPPDGNGVAVGFPWSKQLPLASTPKGTLPMLRVLPGRLNVSKLVTTTKGYTEEKISVRSPGARTVQKASRRSSPHESNLRAAAQRAMLQQLRERLMASDNDARRTKRGSEDSPSMSLRSEETSAAHSALDALAGVAAALADSACTL